MEFGFILYFFIVFVLGGSLLLAGLIYFVVELVIRKQKWSGRSRKSKAKFIACCVVTLFLGYVPLRMVWVTSPASIPGRYKADGVWGDATITLQSDGSFVETYHFVNDFTGKWEGDGSSVGSWHDDGRDWFTRDIVLEHFRLLAEWDRGQLPGGRTVIVMGYGGVTSIEVDSGADITFFKQ